MKLKGFDKFRLKIPALTGRRVIILPIYVVGMISLALYVLITFFSLPNHLQTQCWDPALLSFFPLFGFLTFGVLGFFLIFQVWAWRDHLKAKYGALSYQRIILVGFGGIILVGSLSASLYLPFYQYSASFWQMSPFHILATPLVSILTGDLIPLSYVQEGIALLLLIIGLLMIFRALTVIGFDYATVVYLYFPEESEIQRNEIYSALRHPMYAGVIMIGLGGAIFTGTLYSFLFFLCILVGFYLHVHFVEEKELLQRFGEGYAQYLKATPAFFVSPRKIRVLLGFLLKK